MRTYKKKVANKPPASFIVNKQNLNQESGSFVSNNKKKSSDNEVNKTTKITSTILKLTDMKASKVVLKNSTNLKTDQISVVSTAKHILDKGLAKDFVVKTNISTEKKVSNQQIGLDRVSLTSTTVDVVEISEVDRVNSTSKNDEDDVVHASKSDNNEGKMKYFFEVLI